MNVAPIPSGCEYSGLRHYFSFSTFKNYFLTYYPNWSMVPEDVEYILEEISSTHYYRPPKLHPQMEIILH